MSFDDLSFLKTGDYEICCMLRRLTNGKREHGYLINGSWSLILGNVHAGEYLGDIEYNSPQEIIQDGWTVD